MFMPQTSENPNGPPLIIRVHMQFVSRIPNDGDPGTKRVNRNVDRDAKTQYFEFRGKSYWD